MIKSIVLVLFILTCTAAFAADVPRKIDFTQVLLDPDGQPLTDCIKVDEANQNKCIKTKELTLGDVAMQALNVPERDISYTDANKRGQLGLSVYKSTEAVLTSDEITLIKKQLAKRWSPIVVARAIVLLDPAEK
jgi:hypothetical protein